MATWRLAEHDGDPSRGYRCYQHLALLHRWDSR